MFGSGPSEEIRLEAKMAREKPMDEQASQARFDEHLDDEHDVEDAGERPGPLQRLKAWFAAKF